MDKATKHKFNVDVTGSKEEITDTKNVGQMPALLVDFVKDQFHGVVDPGVKYRLEASGLWGTVMGQPIGADIRLKLTCLNGSEAVATPDDDG